MHSARAACVTSRLSRSTESDAQLLLSILHTQETRFGSFSIVLKSDALPPRPTLDPGAFCLVKNVLGLYSRFTSHRLVETQLCVC
jgi:hypothetical protein